MHSRIVLISINITVAAKTSVLFISALSCSGFGVNVDVETTVDSGEADALWRLA